jgi:hypothetical protein
MAISDQDKIKSILSEHKGRSMLPKPVVHKVIRVTLSIIITVVALHTTSRLTVVHSQANASVPADQLDAAFLADWVRLLFNQVTLEKLSAPEASRVYGYVSVAIWEAALPGMPGRNSLSGQLNELPDMPLLAEENAKYDWQTSVATAFQVVSDGLLTKPESKKAFKDLLAKQAPERKERFGADVIKRSTVFGTAIGKAILDWASTDHYSEIKDQPYELPKYDDSTYVLTTPNTKPANPLWGQLRSFSMDYNGKCNVPLKLHFDTKLTSDFYAQAMEVKKTRDKLTDEQKATAEFWVDTPGITGTPAGHWMMIGAQLIKQKNLMLDQAAGMFVMIGVASADSFISCWGYKYEVLLLRPESYIKKYISRSWSPYIQTPPFPEYPSGHSVVSAAVAEVLTDYFGPMSFTDDTHKGRGLAPRFFTSFEAASAEAAISRLYGGIHYRNAIEAGMRQGRCIGRNIISKILLQPLGNG